MGLVYIIPTSWMPEGKKIVIWFGSGGPDHPGHQIDVLILDLVYAAGSLRVPGNMEYANPGGNDPHHGCDRVVAD